MSVNAADYPKLPDGIFCPVCSAKNAQAYQTYTANLSRLTLYVPPTPVFLPTGVSESNLPPPEKIQTTIDEGVAAVRNLFGVTPSKEAVPIVVIPNN